MNKKSKKKKKGSYQGYSRKNQQKLKNQKSGKNLQKKNPKRKAF